MKKTKIVATLGPASSSLRELTKMMEAGLDIVRLNFSHGTIEEKKELINRVHQAIQQTNKSIAILGDLQGPKIRIARFKNGEIRLAAGEIFALDADLDRNAGDQEAVGIDYKALPKDVNNGDTLLLNDGAIVLTVEKIVKNRVICRVKVGGVLSNNKGINRQGGGLSAGALTDKDREDLRTAVELQLDYIAISFVRSAEDVLETKRLIKLAGGNLKVISKIERVEAIDPKALCAIVEAGDGIMVARGDLGVEIGEAAVPTAQKIMIEYARMLGKPVITATQMMETMIHNVVPTRAEVSDVANAILDGTDAVMLSAETATGKHPALVIKTVAEICKATEPLLGTAPISHYVTQLILPFNLERTIGQNAVELANKIAAKAVVVLTNNGTMPLWISRTNTLIPIVALTDNFSLLKQMFLFRNVVSSLFKYQGECAGLKMAIVEHIKQLNLVAPGDKIVILEEKEAKDPYQTDAILVLHVS